MQDHDHWVHKSEPDPGFWQSSTGIALIVFLVIAAILLGYEHRVHIFGGTSGSFVFLAVWIAMHFFMHRGHGGHGGHGSHSKPRAKAPDDQTNDTGDKP